MFCTHCGAPIEGNQKFCTQCGAPVDLNMTGEYDNPYHVNPDTVGDEDLAIIRGKGFWENFKYVITKKFATIEGRASRGEYFKFYSVSAVIFSLIWFVAAISANISMSLYVALSIVCFVFGLVLFIPSFCLNVRRLHDVGRSGAWILVNFVPFGEFYFLYLICSEGQAIMNRYGRKTNYVGLTSEEAARIGKPASPTDYDYCSFLCIRGMLRCRSFYLGSGRCIGYSLVIKNRLPLGKRFFYGHCVTAMTVFFVYMLTGLFASAHR